MKVNLNLLQKDTSVVVIYENNSVNSNFVEDTLQALATPSGGGQRGGWPPAEEVAKGVASCTGPPAEEVANEVD